MKTIIILLLTLFAIEAHAIYTHSKNYTAVCAATMSFFKEPTHAYFKNDSLHVDFSLYGNCCAGWDFQISELTKDTLFLLFSDTSQMVCDCECDFNIKVNAGIFNNEDLKINLNGKWITILPADYMPIVESYKVWNSLRIIPYADNGLATSIEQSIDSTWYNAFCWNGKFYHKINSWATTINGHIAASDSSAKFIREENGKVYYLDTTGIAYDGCAEYLLYNFSANSGDTLLLGKDSIKYIITYSDDLILSNRRAYSLIDISHPELSFAATWIEGIGDLRGLFNSTLSLALVGSSNILTCCSDKNGFIYQNPSYPDCGKSFLTQSDLRQNNIRIFPIPASRTLEIEGLQYSEDYTYQIIDINGKTIISDKISNQLTLDLANGLYIFRIFKNSETIYQDKLIIYY